MKKVMPSIFLAVMSGILLYIMVTPVLLIVCGAIFAFAASMHLLGTPKNEVPVTDLEMYSRTSLLNLMIAASMVFQTYWNLDFGVVWSNQELIQLVVVGLYLIISGTIGYVISSKYHKELMSRETGNDSSQISVTN